MTASGPLDFWDWNGPEDLLARLRALLESRFPGEVLALVIHLEATSIELSGTVASEECRSAAVRLLHGFDRVLHVEDRIEVVGFLVPAQKVEDDEPVWEAPSSAELVDPPQDGVRAGRRRRGRGRSDPPPEPKLEEVVRYPSIEADRPLVAGTGLRVTVDLATSAYPSTSGVVRLEAPSGWKSLDLTVQLISPMLRIVQQEGAVLTLRRDGPNDPATFDVEVDASASGSINVSVQFVHRTRFCGSANRRFAVSSGSLPEPIEDVRASVTIVPAAEPPDLLVSIRALEGSRFMWIWNPLSRAGLGVGRFSGLVDLGAAPERYANALFESCSDLDDVAFRRQLRGIGEQIWAKTPDEFRRTYADMRNAQGDSFSIQFVSDDPWVPWELMRPVLGDGSLPADHIMLTHPIASWPAEAQGQMRDWLPDGRIVTFSPQYSAHHALPGARRESERLVADLGATLAVGTRAGLLDLLENPSPETVGIVHFAGHGGEGIRGCGLEMEDGWLVLDEVRQTGVSLGRRDHSLVVLNACVVGAAAAQLGVLDGWPAALAANRFGGVVAPLWEVEDEAALEIVVEMLQLLVEEGRTLGEALSEARRRASDSTPTAFAFLAHGDVMARRREVAN